MLKYLNIRCQSNLIILETSFRSKKRNFEEDQSLFRRHVSICLQPPTHPHTHTHTQKQNFSDSPAKQ